MARQLDRRMKRGSALYLYCVLLSSRRPRLSGRAPSLPGASPPRLVPAPGGLWLVVADAPLERFGETALEKGMRDLSWVTRCAVAHQGVIDGVRGARGVLPVKLFTIFTSEERALDHLDRKAREVKAALRKVAGCEEWGVRVVRRGAPAPPARGRRGAAPAAPRSGVAFLLEKKRQREAERESAERALRETRLLHGTLSRRAAASRVAAKVNGAAGWAPLLLDAAYLVPAKAVRGFRETARKAARALEGTGCEVSLSGPWPPYNFVEVG